jgi:hypothetical protein
LVVPAPVSKPYERCYTTCIVTLLLILCANMLLQVMAIRSGILQLSLMRMLVMEYVVQVASCLVQQYIQWIENTTAMRCERDLNILSRVIAALRSHYLY